MSNFSLGFESSSVSSLPDLRSISQLVPSEVGRKERPLVGGWRKHDWGNGASSEQKIYVYMQKLCRTVCVCMHVHVPINVFAHSYVFLRICIYTHLHLHNTYFSNEIVLFSPWSSENRLFVFEKLGEFRLQTDFYFTLLLCGRKERIVAT